MFSLLLMGIHFPVALSNAEGVDLMFYIFKGPCYDCLTTTSSGCQEANHISWFDALGCP